MLFHVWCEEYGQEACDARPVKALDAEEAAKIWARDSDARSDDYLIVGGTPATVQVREAGLGNKPVCEFVVYGESVPRYSARAVVASPRLPP